MTEESRMAEELAQLRYYKDIKQRRSWIARVTVLVIALGLLALNTYLMFVSTSTIVLNIDLARIEQSDQIDLLHARLDRMDRRITARAEAVEPPQDELLAMADASLLTP
jgi:hypothetical protein